MTRTGLTALLLALPLLVVVGCDDEEPAQPRTTDPVQENPDETVDDTEPVAMPIPEPTEAQQRMHDRYWVVDAIREALIDGDLEQAQAHARTLSPVTAVDVPDAAENLRGAVAEEGSALAGAGDLATATREFGQLLESCGNCHKTATATWIWDVPQMPEGDDSVRHMQRHQWALDRMWEALLVHDADHFDMGARALADAPLLPSDPSHDEESSLPALAGRVHELVATLPAEGDMPARAQLFGQLLTTCATCHRQLSALDQAGVR